MKTMIRTFFIYALFWAVGTSTDVAAQSLPLDRIKLPPGFSIETYARIDGARSMAVVESLKTVFVGTRGSKVYAVLDADRDFKADRVITVLSGLKVPNGIAWKDGYLYVAEQHRIVRFKATDLPTLQRAKAEVLYANLPDDAWHGWRYTGFGPDGRLVTVDPFRFTDKEVFDLAQSKGERSRELWALPEVRHYDPFKERTPLLGRALESLERADFTSRPVRSPETHWGHPVAYESYRDTRCAPDFPTSFDVESNEPAGSVD